MKKYIEYIGENTIRCEASHRGGGIEIDLDELLGLEGYAMTAYQNYLGGGMLGSICNSYNFEIEKLSKARRVKVEKMADVLNRYFHDMTNHNDKWESASYEQNQLRSRSAY